MKEDTKVRRWHKQVTDTQREGDQTLGVNIDHSEYKIFSDLVEKSKENENNAKWPKNRIRIEK